MKRNISFNNITLLSFLFPLLLLGSKGSIKLNRIRISFPAPCAEDLNRGYIETDYHPGEADLSIQVFGAEQKQWNLYVTAEHPFFLPVHLEKPHNDLMWKRKNEPDSQYRSVRLNRTLITTGHSFVHVDLDFRMKLGWHDLPSEYIIEIIFELEEVKP